MSDRLTETVAMHGCVECASVFSARASDLLDRQRRVRCPVCGHAVAGPRDLAASRRRTSAFTLAALVLYPPAILLPIMRIDRLGATHETGVVDGIGTLAADGHLWLAMVVLICSVVVPILKLTGLLVLSTSRIAVSIAHRRRTRHWVEGLGRWGMLDVLLVAVLVSVVKLGDLVRIEPGEGAAIFAAMVACSLLASAVFDPRAVRLEAG